MTGVGGPGGFATKVGFSGAPLSTSPLPDVDEMPPSFTVEERTVGGNGFGATISGTGVFCARMGGVAGFGVGAGSSATGSEILVPSVHSMDSGAQSSSSSSMSAQLACLPGSSDCSLVAR